MEDKGAWRENAPFIYSFIATHVTTWPSLTCSWTDISSWNGDYSNAISLGTYTNGEEPESVYLIHADVPSVKCKRSFDRCPDYYGFPLPNRTSLFSSIKESSIPVEANRFRVSSKIGLGAAIGSQLYVVDLVGTLPPIHLKGHQAAGWAVAWSPNDPTVLATGADDAALVLWDVQSGAESLSPKQTYRGHKLAIQDIAWTPHQCVLAAVGDDGMLSMWDTRTPQAHTLVKISSTELNSLSVNGTHTNLLAAGGQDGNVTVWDVRNLKTSLHCLMHHDDAVFSVEFSQVDPHLILTGSNDKSALVWDLSRIGMEQDVVDAELGPPELIFTHAGHDSPIVEVCWHPTESGVVATLSDDNNVHIWKPDTSLLQDDDDDVITANIDVE